MNMGTPYDTKKFKKLKDRWDKKLSDMGFEDIENADGTLKAETDSRTIRSALRDERETYYTIAREFMNTYEWPEITVKQIWAAHIEGIGRARIARMLHLTYYRVNTTIVALQKLAKLRKIK